MPPPLPRHRHAALIQWQRQRSPGSSNSTQSASSLQSLQPLWPRQRERWWWRTDGAEKQGLAPSCRASETVKVHQYLQKSDSNGASCIPQTCEFGPAGSAPRRPSCTPLSYTAYTAVNTFPSLKVRMRAGVLHSEITPRAFQSNMDIGVIAPVDIIASLRDRVSTAPGTATAIDSAAVPEADTRCRSPTST